MGLVLPWPAFKRPEAQSLRLLSFNVDSGFFGAAAIAAQIAAANPDVVLIQEGQFGGGELAETLRASYPHVDASTQFTVASRFPIVAATDPERLPYFGRQRSPRFMRYVIETSLGAIAFYSLHPISPRGALHIHRFHDVLHQLRTGAFLSGDPEADVVGNAGLRELQIATAADLASREHVPVILAGDTNLPGLSAIFRKNLARYADAFRAASWGFGYTFPTKQPFLRLDRILAGPELRFTSFHLGCAGVSDHLCVMADIERQR
jgi:endonuclease/exonuclease/phosphatase (EEP) superfamily protein YafD